MCFTQGVLVGLDRYNWDGDKISYDTALSSHRFVVGKSKDIPYYIDIRSFLSSEHNSVLRKVIEVDIKHYMMCNDCNIDLFSRKGSGGFDYRAVVISQYVSSSFKYKSKKFKDPWRFPEETAMLKEGDCEDISFLLASLMIVSGISPYNIRVVLGRIKLTGNDQASATYKDHCWVMYKRESGKWMVIEPLYLYDQSSKSRKKTSKAISDQEIDQAFNLYEYQPCFSFNGDHLWVYDSNINGTLGDFIWREWEKIDPRFIGKFHENIVMTALSLCSAPEFVKREISRRFTHIPVLGTLDSADDFVTSGYDPRDHFDNGLIKQGWDKVRLRLDDFRAHNEKLGQFAWAAHAIADFYAHSSYVHFSKKINPDMLGGHAVVYDPDNQDSCLERPIAYDESTGFDLRLFSPNGDLYKGNMNDAANYWSGQIISGRYAQRPESRQDIGIFERTASMLDDIVNNKAYEFDNPWCSALPHHDEIAVDGYESTPKTNLLYHNQDTYDQQLKWRKFGAIEHIKTEFNRCWNA